jgi:hypothetical protein
VPYARKEFVWSLLLFLDAYPMALKVVCDGLDEAVGEASVGAFRIIGVESEALVAEDLDAADALYRAGRAAPKRGTGFGLDHLGVESRVHICRDTEVGQLLSDCDAGLYVGDDDIPGEERLDLMLISDCLEGVSIEAGLADIRKDFGRGAEQDDAHELLVSPYCIHEALGQEGPQFTLTRAVELDDTDDFVLFQVDSRWGKDSLGAALDCQCQQCGCD